MIRFAFRAIELKIDSINGNNIFVELTLSSS